MTLLPAQVDEDLEMPFSKQQPRGSTGQAYAE